MTDEAGTQYVFGGTPNDEAIEYSLDFFNQSSDTWYAGTWHLTKIIDSKGRIINLSYERGHFNNQMYASIYYKESQTIASDKGWLLPFYASNNWLTPQCSSQSSLSPSWGIFGGKLISPVYLKEINGNNIQVKFHSSSTKNKELKYNPSVYDSYRVWALSQGKILSDMFRFLYSYTNPSNPNSAYGTYPQVLDTLQWRRLDSIQVVDKYSISSPISSKIYSFSYNNLPTERLKLSSIEEKSADQSIKIPKHQFEYYNSPTVDLPDYLYNELDHWGFYNGTIAQINGLNFTPYYGLREPTTDTLKALEGTLKKISYPTGGVAEFYYEQHKYAKKVKDSRWLGVDTEVADKIAGGLRVKKIRSFDPVSPNVLVERKFFYEKGYNPVLGASSGRSSGILGSIPQYYWNTFQTISPSDPNQIHSYKIFSTQSIYPVSENSMGSHIVYSEVVEKLSTGGTTIHRFSNFDATILANGETEPERNDESHESTLQPTASPYAPYTSRAFQRGQPISQEIYDSMGQPVSKSFFRYTILPREEIRAIKSTVYPSCPNTFNYIYEGTSYKTYTTPYKVDKVESFNHHQTIPSAFVKSLTNYSYNAFGQVNEIRKSQSDGSFLVSKMKSIPEYKDTLQPICLANRDVCYMSCPNCMTIEEAQEWRGECDDTYMLCINVPYDQTANAILKMKSKHIWSMVEELKYRKRGITETIIGGNITLPKEFTFNSVNNLMPSKVYKLHIANPIASNTVSFSDVNLSRNFEYDTKYKRPEIEFVDYNDEGHLLEVKDYGNVSTSYLWGYRNRLPIAEVKNATYATITTELTASVVNNLKNNVVSESVIRSAVNQLRTGIDRKVSSYTHDPIYGVKSIADASNITNYFERDGLGRLKTAKDKDGFILKNYSYQYAGGSTGVTGCTVAAPTITADPASTGCNTVLTVSACSGTTIWSNTQTGNTITVPSVATPTYTATCTTTCISPASNALAGLNLPSGWSPVETGTGVNGCTILGNSQIKMNVAPSGGVGGSDPDTYYYMDKQYTGNVTIIAKISSMSTTASIRAGLMFRSSNSIKSPFFQIVQAGDDVVGKFYRNVENDEAKIWKYGTGIPAGAWLRIKKVGNNVNSYYSTIANPNINNDGDWTEILPNVLNPDPSITWGTNFLIGMCLTNAVGSGIPSAQVIWSSVQVDNNGVLETPFN